MDAKAVLQLYFGCEPRDIGEVVVFTPLPPSNLDDFKELCDEVRGDFSGWVGSGFAGSAEGCHVTVICPGTGSSQIGDATLAVGYGPCEVAIFVGSVGGLDDDMNLGDIVVVEEAVIGEGFSRYRPGQDAIRGPVWPDCPS